MNDDAAERFPESRKISGERKDLSRRESSMKARIIDLLGDGPRTVPEIAEALAVPADEAMWWVMGCWRYGLVAPTGDVTDDGYYKYKRADGQG